MQNHNENIVCACQILFVEHVVFGVDQRYIVFLSSKDAIVCDNECQVFHAQRKDLVEINVIFANAAPERRGYNIMRI